jgi:putative transposase
MSKYKKFSHSIYYLCISYILATKVQIQGIGESDKRAYTRRKQKLSEYKGVEVIELNIQKDHIHLVVSIPPKISVSEYMGYLKVKRLTSNFWGLNKKFI